MFGDAGSDQVLAIRPRDGGASFEPATDVARLLAEDVSGVRAPPFASVAVDASGRPWAAWQDCRHRPECGANEIVLASSTDGAAWSAPAPVPVGTRDGVDAFVPGLAVDPARGGARARLALVYHTIAPPGDSRPTSVEASTCGSSAPTTPPARGRPRSG